MKEMDNEEKDVARSIVDYLSAGDDKIASMQGTITLHSHRMLGSHFASLETILARVDGSRTDEYEITVTARRRR